MPEHTKMHRINAAATDSIFYISYHHKVYAIPTKIAEQFVLDAGKAKKLKIEKSILTAFDEVDKAHTKAGALLKGLRLRENLTQVAFAKRIKVTQANLSNMENGRRAIGKIIAKRIEKIFGTNYRYFLE